MRGNNSSLVIGSSEGAFGLWLDEALCQGRSQVGPGSGVVTFLCAGRLHLRQQAAAWPRGFPSQQRGMLGF